MTRSLQCVSFQGGGMVFLPIERPGKENTMFPISRHLPHHGLVIATAIRIHSWAGRMVSFAGRSLTSGLYHSLAQAKATEMAIAVLFIIPYFVFHRATRPPPDLGKHNCRFQKPTLTFSGSGLQSTAITRVQILTILELQRKQKLEALQKLDHVILSKL